MSITQTMGVQVVRDGWWRRTLARLKPAPSRPPAFHASRITRTANTRPGLRRGRHRCIAGGVIVTYRLTGGRYISFRRHP